MPTNKYPKRLIEVDLPIKKISAHARREKSIRHGHISTLHIWWARRPLAACRAVICAALWPDPVDENCPQAFRDAAAKILAGFAEQSHNDATVAGLVKDHWSRWHRTNAATFQPAGNFAVWPDMREALLDFIADFANWDASTVPAFLETARALTQAAHESLGGIPGTRPLVVDPFAGGGAIPLEALRVGADAFASDLNPVAVLLNKVVLEYIPKYGNAEFRFKATPDVIPSQARNLPRDGDEIVLHGLAEAVRYWGNWIKEQAEAELAEFYPPDPDGATPIAYLWARTIISEAPDDGSGVPVEVPLMRSLWLAKKTGRNKALRWVRDGRGNVKTETVEVGYADGVTRTVRRPMLEIFEPKRSNEVEDGTVARGSATCPVTGYTTPVGSVRRQLAKRRGGTGDARLFAIVTIRPGNKSRFYRLPDENDLDAIRQATSELERRKQAYTGSLALVPDELTPKGGGSGAGRAFSQRNYGMDRFEDLFTPRQALALTTLVRLVQQANDQLREQHPEDFAVAVQTVLSMVVDKLADSNSGQIWWMATGEKTVGTFTRQTIQMIWDFGELPLTDAPSRSLDESVQWILRVIEHVNCATESIRIGQAIQADACESKLPDDAVNAFISDPPYYDAVPYADLSDFFFVWLKRTLPSFSPLSINGTTTPKDEECILDEVKGKDRLYFERKMTQAMAEGYRILHPDGISVIVFAHKTTSGWEAMLQGLLASGWIITGTWPIDTERQVKVNTIGRAFLGSSIHLVCRPRKGDKVGDWRDVLQELPERIHAWLPRLAREGVVGADAIFACLGPALEIYSRYSRVEKASGEQVTLKEYLEYVWAAVSKEALSMVFEGADASGFEEDARLTAMWLWTLNTDAGEMGNGGDGEMVRSAGYTLEYDAARKIAQGLGAHLENLGYLVEIKGSDARLLPVSARTQHLFGKEGVDTPRPTRKREQQLSLFDTAGEGEAGAGANGWGDLTTPGLGQTTLDRVHQSLLLFASGRGEALRRFLVEEGVGQDTRYWALANALSALYPANTDEKRWVDGVLARKKGLGF